MHTYKARHSRASRAHHTTSCAHSLDNLPQPAPPLARSAAPTAAPSQCMHKIDHFPVSDVRNTCTICVIRHSWESVTQGNFRKIDHFPVGDGFPWVTDNTRTCATRTARHRPTPSRAQRPPFWRPNIRCVGADACALVSQHTPHMGNYLSGPPETKKFQVGQGTQIPG